MEILWKNMCMYAVYGVSMTSELPLCLSFISLILFRWKTRFRYRPLQAPHSAPSWTFSSAVLSSWPWLWPASFHLWWAQPLWAFQLWLPWPWLPWLVCWSWPLWCCPYGEIKADDTQMDEQICIKAILTNMFLRPFKILKHSNCFKVWSFFFFNYYGFDVFHRLIFPWQDKKKIISRHLGGCCCQCSAIRA